MNMITLHRNWRTWVGALALSAGVVALTVAPARSEERDVTIDIGNATRAILRPYPPAPFQPMGVGMPGAAAVTLPADAAAKVAAFVMSESDLRREMVAKLAPRRAELIAELSTLQDQHTKAGHLDEAIAIRERVRQLKRDNEANDPNGDPGTLANYRDRVGKTFTFDLVGSTHGTIWGTDVYTDDSSLATAAVHAGLLKDGERGKVRVTILPPAVSYTPSDRNGVASQPWGQWQGSFKFDK
jgi:hypothetical protein